MSYFREFFYYLFAAYQVFLSIQPFFLDLV